MTEADRALLEGTLRNVKRTARAAKSKLRRLPTNRATFKREANRFLDFRIIASPRGRERLLLVWRAWAAVAPRLPRGDESLTSQAKRLGGRLTRLRQPDTAVEVYMHAENRVADDDRRLSLAVQRTSIELLHGFVPDDLTELTADLLGAADRAHDRGDLDTAADRLYDALNLAYNRTLHFETLPSPLGDDPRSFLRPFRDSVTFRHVIAPSGTPRPTRPGVASRPRRLLVTTVMNFNFAQGIIDELAAGEDVEIRTLDLRTIPDGPWRAHPHDLLRNRLRQSHGEEMAVPEEVREPFDWADTVFVEWGHRAMAWVSMLPRLTARVIVRLHSYEAFTPMPLQTDWSGIDDLVFVSPHIRSMLTAAVPELASGPRLHTIPNRNILAPYRRPKKPGSEYTLGLVGWGQVTKDAIWALDLLEELRARDPRWRLQLIGNGFAPTHRLTRPAAEYRDRLQERIEQLGDAVTRLGYTEDIPEALRDLGVIVSSSHREGTHEGLIQGVASGAFPVVRNWPYVAKWGGPGTLFPRDWIVDTPAEGAQLVYTALQNGPLLEQTGAMAEWITKRYDWATVGPRLKELLLQPGSNQTTPAEEGPAE